MSNFCGFRAIETNQAVDCESGVIRGVSVITVGEAAGHNLWVDGDTLSQLNELSGKRGSIKVKINHPVDGSTPAFESTAGQLNNFRVEGNHVRADLELLKSEALYDKIMEMAQQMPKDFGLSVRVAYEKETKDGKDFLRPTDIESVDLVDSPAANPNGLFSAKPAKQPTNKPMSALIAKALGLAETASEPEVVAELSKRLDAAKPTDLTELTKQITGFTAKITELDQKAKDAAESARKTEVAALVAEASRDGKVVPLTDAQLAKMDIADIKEMLTKLPKSQVSLQRKPMELPKNKDGVRLQGRELVEFCRQKQAEGIEALNQKFATLN